MDNRVSLLWYLKIHPLQEPNSGDRDRKGSKAKASSDYIPVRTGSGAFGNIKP